MKKSAWKTLIFILIITTVAGMVAWPYDVWIFKGFRLHPGLDLKGGAHLVYQLNTQKIDEKDRDAAIEGVLEAMEQRVNLFGLTEPVIQQTKLGDQDAVIVELPGVQDVAVAKELIGQTAKLEFRQPRSDQNKATTKPNDPLSDQFEPSDLTGADLKRADVIFAQGNSQAIAGSPQVQIKFNQEGTKKFRRLTQKYLGQPIAIYLDGVPISIPTVQAEITDGQAVITGNFTVDTAKRLAIQLNAGALPVDVKLIEERTIGPTLGQEAVQKSLIAGLIGLILVAVFMIAYYRLIGLLAAIALTLYILFNIAIFEWLAITLTLAGIAGFILSIGFAVDANILVFERFREERFTNKPVNLAIEESFRRAMSSVGGSNISSLITAVILYFTTSGLVKNFAVTLAIGIIVSLFTTIVVTRTLMRLALKERV